MTLKERLLDIQRDLADAYVRSKAGINQEVFHLNKFQITFTEENLPSIAELCKRHSYIIEAKSIEDFYFNLNKWLFKAEDLDTPNFPTVVLVSILAVQNYYRNL